MKSSVIIKTLSLITAGAISLTALAGCSKSFLLPEESTTKAAYDEDSVMAEYNRTSVPGEETEPETAESEENTGEESTTAQGTTKAAGSTTSKETAAGESVTSKIEETVSQVASALSTAAQTTKHVVSSENKTTETKENYKYGVVKINVVSTYYDVYSDGSKVENRTKSKTYTKYDYSGFKATTSEMKSEAASNASAYSSQASAAVSAVNALRSSALTVDSGLTTAANVRAVEMAYSGKVDGTQRPDKSVWSTVLTDCGLTASSSAIDFVCSGYSDGASAVSAISATSSNKTKMQDTHYKKIGVGFAKNPEGKMFCCIIVTE